MAGLVRVQHVEVLEGRALRLVFSDGLVRELDFAGVLTGVLTALDDDEVFGAASVDGVAGTVCFPGGIDFDPDVLHGDEAAASSLQPSLVREYRLEHTS